MRIMTLAVVSLVTLVVQNALVVLMTRYSRMSAKPEEVYYTSTLVLMQEVVKFVICLFLFELERKTSGPGNTGPSALGGSGGSLISVTAANSVVASATSLSASCTAAAERTLRSVILQKETIKIVVPAGLFTIQNFLLFVSLSNLDVMTFQVLSQTKLLSAALFSVWFLDKRLTMMQWLSLVVLTVGVFLAQYQSVPLTKVAVPAHHARDAMILGGALATSVPTTSVAPSLSPMMDTASSSSNNSFFIGATTCILSGLSSSFAGVYFEKVVKTTPPTLAIRNLQLGVFAIPMAIVSMLLLDVWSVFGYKSVDKLGHPKPFDFWRGWSLFTWALVVVHAIGGLLVAVVVKYADNILKGFATAVAVILSGILARIIWGYDPTAHFIAGCALVLASTIMYQWYAAPPPQH